MFPPQSNTNIDIEALSGICGSISIACWVVVFSPQIIENFRRSSAEGLSVVFIVVWLLGDVFNILGAILQGVLPTMTILAVYYTLADIVLLAQVFYYRGFTLKDEVQKKSDESDVERRIPVDERQPLLSRPSPDVDSTRRQSYISEQLVRHGEHFSPVTPLHSEQHNNPAAVKTVKPTSTVQAVLFNTSAIIVVCLAGLLGWWLSERSAHHRHHHHKHRYEKHTRDTETGPLELDLLGQIFGYLCAALYLSSRIPQLLLNYKRKSTEGVSLLFFLFACIGNLTYDMSIFAYNPQNACQHGPGHCESGEARALYIRYIVVNMSWIIGSLGTLVLDGAIFVQFFLYKKDDTRTREQHSNGGLSNGHAT